MTKAAIIIVALFAVTAFSSVVTLDEVQPLWSSWKMYYGKSYTLAEEKARLAIFAENYKRVIQINSEDNTFKTGLNKFADLTGEEFKSIYASGLLFDETKLSQLPKARLTIGDLPKSVDWRTKGAVTPVKNQQQCGSCWAFSATGALEGLYFNDNGKLLSFSEQQLVDCDTNDSGCNGGLPSSAFNYTAINGIETESDYPYDATDGTCQYDASKAVKVNTGYEQVNASVDDMKTAIVQQVVSVGVEADQDVFQLYTSGVVTRNCGAQLDHGVLVVGYETVGIHEAFIVKNSWGADWGQNGYLLISTNVKANNGAGVCGIYSAATIPTNS